VRLLYDSFVQKSVFSPEQAILQRILRRLRRRAGLRQADLANQLGKPQPFVSRYEKGEKMLDIVELRQICHVLGISLVDLVGQFEEEIRRAEI